MRALLVVLLLGLASPAWAVTRYVDNQLGGNCSGNYSIANRTCSGSDGNAYTTIAAGIAATASNDTLHIRGGTVYTATTPIVISGKSGTSYVSPTLIAGCGTWTNPVTGATTSNASCPSDARPIWRPSSITDHLFYFSASTYVVMQGLELDAVNQSGVGLTVALVDGASSFIKFDHTRMFRGQFGNILCGQTSHDVWITGNYISEAGRDVQETSQEHGVYCEGQDHLIEYNDVNLSSSYGIHSYGVGSGDEDGQVIRYNLIHDNSQVVSSGMGILQTYCNSGCAIYGNVIYNNGKGIDIWNTTGLVIYNNTIVGNVTEGIWLESATSTIIRNNISVNNGTDYSNSGGTSTTANNNLCSSGCDEGGGAPTFVSAGAGDYRLAVGSNGIDDGATLGSPYNSDLRGVLRPLGSAYDLGAYEYVPAPGAPTDPKVDAPPVKKEEE